MLEEAGFAVRVLPPDLDDGVLRPGRVTPEQWVMALAYLKARRVREMIIAANWPLTGIEVILGADTVCVTDGEILGQPRDIDHARQMLHALRCREHQTITGVCLIHREDNRWRHRHFVDSTTVRIGDISDAMIDQYVQSGDWRGKAGAYNLSERINAGWPIEWVGDPATVMGLPMRRLAPMLRSGF
jgi:septum formation protein